MPQDLVAVALAAAALAVVLLLIGFLLLARRRGRARRAARGVQMASPGQDARLAAELERLATLERRVAALDERSRDALRHVGIVRFNPFEDTGSNQSFALALLDDRGNGVVVSSLHSRQSTRVYLKPISGGRSEITLSDEEAEAVRRAGAGH
jgi:hypothetical protein